MEIRGGQIVVVCVFRDALVVPILMGLTSVFAGFVVFSVVGFMATVVGRPIAEVVEKGRVRTGKDCLTPQKKSCMASPRRTKPVGLIES